MSVKVIKNIVNPIETLATVGEVFQVTKRYNAYGTEWVDLTNDRTSLNVQVSAFNYFFKEA